MHCRHRGFTLVELLVVLAIMAILLALLFPAVLSARSSALDAKCKNQLRQVGLALAAYHDQHLALPPGWIGDPAEGGTGWGWAAMLLPFLEQAPLCDQAVQFERPLSDHAHYWTLVARVPVYRCPADIGGGTFDWTTQSYAAARGVGTTTLLAARWNFAHLRGAQSAAGCLPAIVPMCPICQQPLPPEPPQPPTDDPPPSQEPPVELPSQTHLATGNYVGSFGALDLAEARAQSGDGPWEGDGVFFENSRIKYRDIRDGLSHTFLIGERGSRLGRSTWLGLVGSGEAAAARIVGVADLPPNHPESRWPGYGSYHRGGAHFLFGDGAVHFVTAGIEAEIFRALATRSGGEIASVAE